jgi:C1A family cysteine protease
MRSFAALTAAATATVMTETDFKFIQYIAKHNKNYKNIEEFNFRKANFEYMESEINRLNALNAGSVHGHNKFSDWSRQEYEGILNLKNVPAPEVNPNSFIEHKGAVPNAVNWVTAGYVYPVKDQAQCGSCWAFSTTGSSESSYAINHGLTGSNMVSLSEQQLVSCSQAYGNQGCNGGWYYYAW